MNDNITRDDVIKHIHKERKSNFFNHFLTFISKDRFISAEIRKDSIALWTSNPWVGAFFPIFNFKFNSKNELIDITHSKNWFAKIIQIVFYLFFIRIGLYIFVKIDYSLRSLIIPIIFIIVFSLLSYLFYSIYKFETKNQLKDLYDLIGIEIENGKEIKRSEWTLSKIATRLIIYPFSFFFLFISFLFLKEGKIIYGLLGAGIILSYLTTDIIIIFKKSKK